jgi:hypothetical protein
MPLGLAIGIIVPFLPMARNGQMTRPTLLQMRYSCSIDAPADVTWISFYASLGSWAQAGYDGVATDREAASPARA